MNDTPTATAPMPVSGQSTLSKSGEGQSSHINHLEGMYSDPRGHSPRSYGKVPEHIAKQYEETHVGYREPEELEE